ncbi:helix-turn-helix domain-containing protein [Haladaptatus sp. NG-SE-30]
MGTPETTGLRVTLDIWHPDCWTLEVTDKTVAGLLGHGVHTIDGMATGRFTAYGNTQKEVDALIETVRDSDLTESVWETDHPHTTEDSIAFGSASRGIVVRYDLQNSINDALVSRGFIPDEPVRMYGGREYWTVIVEAGKDELHERIEAVCEEMDADIRVRHVATAETGPGILRTDDLSERQREVLELARRRGYYEWPREVTASELATELDLSKTTLLEHLRKAEAKLLG